MISAVTDNLKTIWNYRQVLNASTRVELRKKYSGSYLGQAWVFVYPFLFLSVYLFVYIAVFSLKYEEMNIFESVIYIFSGLLPYLVFVESVNTGVGVIKQNLHIVKNVMFPVELIPMRVCCMALVTQFIGFSVILVLGLLGDSLSWNLLLLPLALLIQMFFLFGLTYLFAVLGLIFVDLLYIVPIILNLFLFISPIGFTASMIPDAMTALVTLNPVYYYIEPFRYAFLADSNVEPAVLLISAAIALAVYAVGVTVFSRFKEHFSDFE